AEIEERTSRPKTILGDIFGVVLADAARIGGRRYSIDRADVLVAMVAPKRGRLAAKYVRLERHVNKYVRVLRESGRSRSVRAVRIVTTTSEDLVRRIERLVRLTARKGLRRRR
ncbi:hypothetical protein JXD38_08515, partial [candidate division WOR-3 bacterium]|nr:hypothetical protein [candidate division WOR-3 bacterium]